MPDTNTVTNRVTDTQEMEGSPNSENLVLQRAHQDLEFRHKMLMELYQSSLECDDLNHFYAKVHETIGSLMNASNFYILNYDQTFSTIEFVHYKDEFNEVPDGVVNYDKLEGSYIHIAIESMKPLLVTPDSKIALSNNSLYEPIVQERSNWLGVPLLQNDLVIGLIVVQSSDVNAPYSEQDLNLLVFAAKHAVGAIIRFQDNERLINAVNIRSQELMAQIREREKSELLQESLYKISELSNVDDFDVNNFYSNVHQIVDKLINATNFFIAKYHEKSDTLEYVYIVDEGTAPPQVLYKKIDYSKLYCKQVIQNKKVVLLSKQDMNGLYENNQAREPETDEHSWLGVPLLYSGQLLGVMVIQSYSHKSTYNQQDAELLNFVSVHVASAIKRRDIIQLEKQNKELLEKQVKLRTAELEEEIVQRKEVEIRLQHTASHDSLTGLPNRLVFMNLLTHAIDYNKQKPDFNFAILFLDLDRFKVVNDSLGHHAGDTLLKLIASKLSSLVREKDTVARLGGDEFVILIEDLESNDEAFIVAQRITDFLKEPIIICDQQVFTGTSIGILFNNKRYQNADAMLRDADTAMYHAKDNGKGRYEVFNASMRKRIKNALSLEADIREAIEYEEFIPFYQPIVKLENEEVQGLEALARWHSSKRGFVFPDDFIPLAEETNLVKTIDFHILKKSCLQLKKWQQTLSRKDLYVSCNLFCNQFFSPTLPLDIEKILLETGLQPQYLRLELTERALLESTDIVLSNMKALKKLGVKILLDDFGTGYSSLSYLHRFPIDVLKIDKSFIHNVHEHENNRAIIKTIVDLATNLKMATVGEGIEHIEDAQLLLKMNCLYGQGYYYAKPMPAIEMEKFILNNTEITEKTNA